MKSFIKEGVDYMNERIKCPVCGKYEFPQENDFDVCEICGWENDGVQYDDPDYEGGANRLSLNQFREKWQAQLKE
jgi:ribosomal protein L37AE/L43A